MVIYSTLKHAITITAFVFVMMLIVDFVDIMSEKKLTALMKGGIWRQYVVASFLGATPGCLGAFMDVSLYVHGLISFGALTGAMIATSGDEAFIMLARFPGHAMLLFGILFLLSLPFAWVADRIVKATGFISCESCALHEYHTEDEAHRITGEGLLENITRLSVVRHGLLVSLGVFMVLTLLGITGPESWGWKRVTILLVLLIALLVVVAVSDHYMKAHIWSHIVKTHMWRVFLWTFFALLFVKMALESWDLSALISQNMTWMFLLAALVAMIPESGPHLVFVMLFAEGMIPFSILLTSSFVQDGHGMLPLLSYTIKDSVLIKILNAVFGLAVGLILYLAGW